ncbi:La-related protein 6 [Halocaridina rubra]|uniref:La-related protein 6 n=1 Tax=Halocaridina rubra TaxID=373956 RepID=A0AAN8ZXP4_HALRR
MLSLLSRIVIGSDSTDCKSKEELHEDSDSPTSSFTGDTDEELVGNPMPIINIDQTELAQEALNAENDENYSSLEQTDSCEDIKDDSSLKEKVEEQVPIVIPSRDVCQRIVELIEYYLSDENLVKDMFLLKHVTKHREGYVSLKLLTSYKKVKRLTKDWRVAAHSLKISKTLELNKDETKVRRKLPLPPELEEDTRPFRTLLATHIGQDRATMNQLAEFFGKFGEMISLQVHKPGGRTLSEVKQAERQHPGIANTVCAMVEYEKVHCARQALRFITNNAEECSMKIMEPPRKRQESLLGVKGKADAESAYYSNSDISDPPSPVYHGHFPLHPKLKTTNSSLTSTPSVSPVLKRRPGKVDSSPESSPPSPYHYRHGPPTPCSSPEDRNPPKPFSSYEHSPYYHRYEVPGSLPLPRRQLPRQIPEPKGNVHTTKNRSFQNNNNSEVSLLPLSPWLRRRYIGNGNESASLASSPSSSPSLRRRIDSPVPVPDNVIRLPKGPDGTKGFVARRSLLVHARA